MKTSLQVPADHGLPSLGLLCLALMSTTVVLGTMFAIGAIAKLGGSDRLLAIAALCAGFVRAGFHYRAAHRLRERSPELVAAARRYFVCAAITTALIVVAITTITSSLSFFSLLVGALLGLYWPVTLWLLVTRKAVRETFSAAETFDATLVPADRSIEGAGVLMTVFSSLGLIALFTYAIMTGDPQLPGTLPLLVYVALLVALFARGVFHLAFGLAAMRGLSATRFDRRGGIYFGLGIATAALMALFLLASARWYISPPLVGLTLIASYFLLAWPMVLKRFSSGLLFDADGQPLPQHGHGPAPDRGLTALGYVLLAFTLTPLVLRATAFLGVSATSTLTLFGFDTPIGYMNATAEALGVWAALELIRVSARRKLATCVYAAMSIATSTIDLAIRSEDTLNDVLSIVLSSTVPLIALAMVWLRSAPLNEATPPHGTPARAD